MPAMRPELPLLERLSGPGRGLVVPVSAPPATGGAFRLGVPQGGATRRALLRAGAWVAAGWLLATLLSFFAVPRAPVPPIAANLLLTLVPAAAAVACLLAGRTQALPLRAVWRAFTWAAAAVALRQLIGIATLLGGGAGPVFALISYALLLVAHGSIAAGAALAIPSLRSRAVAGGLLLDLALVVTAGSLFALQLTVEHGAGMPVLPVLRVVGSQLATGASMFTVGLLLVWRAAELPLLPVLGLVVTALSFGLGNSMLVMKIAATGTGTPMDVLWITGWAGLAFAGLSARAMNNALPGPPPGRVAAVIGGVLIPAGALYVAAIGLAAGLAPYVGGEIGLALWFLAAPLAVRVGQGLRSEAHRKAQGRELEQTRALVELNRALSAAVELEPTLELVTRWARKLTDARAASIQLLSDEQDSLEVVAVTGLPPSAVGLVLPVPESFTGAVVRDRHPRVVGDWKRVGAAHPRELQLFGEDAGAAAPLLFRGRALGVLVVAGCERPFDHEQIAMLTAMADSAAVAIENARLFEEVKALSLTDPLTGLVNRRGLERDLAREFAAARRGRRMTAVMFDIDGFKRFNDTNGHLAGDE
ncbi:MAG TPA: sensor domain-containing diguanylate cyclase, partial [Longimicrobiales bacterium]